jgi:hypothetical protein
VFEGCDGTGGGLEEAEDGLRVAEDVLGALEAYKQGNDRVSTA